MGPYLQFSQWATPGDPKVRNLRCDPDTLTVVTVTCCVEREETARSEGKVGDGLDDRGWRGTRENRGIDSCRTFSIRNFRFARCTVNTPRDGLRLSAPPSVQHGRFACCFVRGHNILPFKYQFSLPLPFPRSPVPLSVRPQIPRHHTFLVS